MWYEMLKIFIFGKKLLHLHFENNTQLYNEKSGYYRNGHLFLPW